MMDWTIIVNVIGLIMIVLIIIFVISKKKDCPGNERERF